MKVMNRLDSSTVNEFSIIWNITHENILRYYDHFNHEINGKEKTCVITEYCQVILFLKCYKTELYYFILFF